MTQEVQGPHESELHEGDANESLQPVGQHTQGRGGRCCERGGRGQRGAGGGAFVEPAALSALLAEGDNYGYDLRKKVTEISGGTIDVDVGSLYRTLRRLEADGFVTSSWNEDGSGPRRRDYVLTAEGVALAEQWIGSLREREKLSGLLADLLEQGFDTFERRSVDEIGCAE